MPPPYAATIHREDTPRDFTLGKIIENFSQARDHLGLAPIAAAKKDEAGAGCIRESEQTRIIEIGGNHCPRLFDRSCQDFGILGSAEAQIGCVDRIMSFVAKPPRQGGR